MIKIAMLSVLSVMTLLTAFSCASTVSQEEYERVSNKLGSIQSELTAMQGKLAEYEMTQFKYENLSKQYDTLESEYKALQDKYDGLKKQYELAASLEDKTMQARYEELSKQYVTLESQYKALQAAYDDLSQQYAAMAEGTAEINEKDVEQAIFKLINQARTDNGLEELTWGDYLYKSAKNHSQYMAANKRLEEPAIGSYQEVIWVTGYTDIQRMVESIFTIWQNSYRYETEFLSSATTYGTVAVYKSGEIFYITYTSGVFK